MNRKLVGLLLLFLFPIRGYSDTTPIDETALFDDASQKVEHAQTSDISMFNNVRSVGFSGRFDSFNIIQGGDKALKGHLSDTGVYALNQADLLLDVRLPDQVKAFADLSLINASSSATSSSTLADVKELFIDYNFKRKVYVRTGKQFIRWGRGYFWNPVDFVNSSRRDFLNLDSMRSGINGTRIHIPGQTQNTYLFLDMNNVSQLDQSALLMKYEWVAGTTEIGTSAWVAPHRASRFGLDMSTHLVGLDISGEWALENEKNWLRVKNTEGVVSVEKGPSIWASSAMINLQRQFNWKRPNRITAIYELYYNGRGYSGDLLKDETMKAVLFSNGLYSANYFSKAYHALFLSINEFPVYATTFSLNAIQNITDQSAILSTGLGYKLTDGLLINSSVLFYLGNANTEYGLSEKHAAVIVQGIITF